MRGDETHRLDYPIAPTDTVLDLGGFRGEWAAAIYNRYQPTIHVFEPVAGFAQQLRERFAGKDKIHVHQLALGAHDRKLAIHLDGIASSVCVGDGAVEEITERPFADWYREAGLGRIALAKINIEGGEYELLEHLIDTGLIKSIDNVQVQFHDFVPDALERMRALQEKLSATHDCTYQYHFIWENWVRKGRAGA